MIYHEQVHLSQNFMRNFFSISYPLNQMKDFIYSILHDEFKLSVYGIDSE